MRHFTLAVVRHPSHPPRHHHHIELKINKRVGLTRSWENTGDAGIFFDKEGFFGRSGNTFFVFISSPIWFFFIVFMRFYGFCSFRCLCLVCLFVCVFVLLFLLWGSVSSLPVYILPSFRSFSFPLSPFCLSLSLSHLLRKREKEIKWKAWCRIYWIYISLCLLCLFFKNLLSLLLW